MHFVACAPEAYFPDKALVATCQQIAAETGATLEFNSDLASAVKGAHVLYTDVWVSMGEPDEVWQQRIDDLLPYQSTRRRWRWPERSASHALPAAFHDLGTGIGQKIHERYVLSHGSD